MLIGCITGPDFQTAKSQIDMANEKCDGIELRLDLLHCDISSLKLCAKKPLIFTDNEKMYSESFSISSYHNYEETPKDLDAILDELAKADIYKISTKANSIIDALQMCAFVKRHTNVAGMCMGAYGQITRILGPIFGSALTFAAIGLPSAPGQLQLEELLNTYRYRALNCQTEIYGLIGSPISESISHVTHNNYFKNHSLNAVYVKMELEEKELPLFFPLVKELGFKGLSVTMPLKEKLFSYVDAIDNEAIAIGALNTLTLTENIQGSNTDAKGGIDALGIQNMNGIRCCILGDGGAAKALAYEAQKRGATVAVHSRKLGNLGRLLEHDVLINATSVPCPISTSAILPRTIVMDITHAHQSSPLLEQARLLNCRVIHSKKMFELQAEGQFARWGHSFSF